MASQIYGSQHSISRHDKGLQTCFAAVWSIAALSKFLKSSIVLTFFILPSARMLFEGTLGFCQHLCSPNYRSRLTHHLSKHFPKLACDSSHLEMRLHEARTNRGQFERSHPACHDRSWIATELCRRATRSQSQMERISKPSQGQQIALS